MLRTWVKKYLRTCDVCGDWDTYTNLKGANLSMYHHERVCAKQKEAVDNYRSLDWDTDAWVVLLTVRGDVFDALLRDMRKLGNN